MRPPGGRLYGSAPGASPALELTVLQILNRLHELLAGVHHGLLKKIDPGAPAKGNVSRDRDATLPFTIDDALAKLAKAEVLPAYFGEETLTLYRETKRIETERLRRVIPPTEYDWYL